MAQKKTIRETVIELAVKLRVAKMHYVAKDSAMINKTCPEYKKWIKASEAVLKKMATPEFVAEVQKNGIVTAKEIDAALEAKYKVKNTDCDKIYPLSV